MDQDVRDVITKTLQHEAQEVMRIDETLDDEQLKEVFTHLSQCQGKIIISGCGTSGIAARKIAHTFNCIQMPALYLSPAEANHGGLGVVSPDDLVILLSKGGETSEINTMIPAIQAQSAKIIGVTERTDSYLSQMSDTTLQIRIEREPDEFNLLATASTLTTLAVFDALALALAKHSGFSKETFGTVHPGGKVGRVLAEAHKLK